MAGTGRREQRKRETFEAVVAAGARLFEARGFKQTSVEQIAEEAGVSPATIYNYFGTKGSILAVIATRATQEQSSTQLGATVPSGDPAGTMRELLFAYIETFLSLDVEVLAEVFRSTFGASHGALAAEMTALDMESIEMMASAYRTMQDAGEIASGIDPEEAAWVTFSLLVSAFLLYMVQPDIGIDGVKATVGRQLDVVFRGFLPR